MNQRLSIFALLFFAFGGQACRATVGSGYATGVRGPAQNPANVAIRALYEPHDREQVGIIEAHTNSANLNELMLEFQQQAAALGGSLAKVDQIVTRFEMVTRTELESYSCGTSQAPRTCTRNVTRMVEVATITVSGRAFR